MDDATTIKTPARTRKKAPPAPAPVENIDAPGPRPDIADPDVPEIARTSDPEAAYMAAHAQVTALIETIGALPVDARTIRARALIDEALVELRATTLQPR